MQSKVSELAAKKGIKSPQELSYKAEITLPTAKKVWRGDLSKRYANTLRKLAAALGCSMDDLFTHEAR